MPIAWPPRHTSGRTQIADFADHGTEVPAVGEGKSLHAEDDTRQKITILVERRRYPGVVQHVHGGMMPRTVEEKGAEFFDSGMPVGIGDNFGGLNQAGIAGIEFFKIGSGHPSLDIDIGQVPFDVGLGHEQRR